MQVFEDDLDFLSKPVDMTPQVQAFLINGVEFPWAFGSDTSTRT